jgi:hypothetical protein
MGREAVVVAVAPADVDQAPALADAVLDLAGEARDQDAGRGSEDADDDPMDVVRVPAVAWAAVARDAARLPDETVGHNGRVC